MKKLSRRDALLALPALALGGLGVALGRKAMIESEDVGGDGGPLVVLQDSAFAQWQGAWDWDNSLMNGGDVETDYDVACAASLAGERLGKRYNRDMLVLDDCEWGGCIVTLDSGVLAFVQRFVTDEPVPALVARSMEQKPNRSFPMRIEDASLRLLPGADKGREPSSFADAAIAPGPKRCDVYESEDSLVIAIRPA